MIFIDFLKAREEKNKYGMIALTFNRRTELSHIVPNVCNLARLGKVFQNFGLITNYKKTKQ